MTRPTRDPDAYRPAVGVVIFNRDGKVWLGERMGKKGRYRWQFPQGGIDKGESPKSAAFRELHEETGLKKKHVTFLAGMDTWLYYDLPPKLQKNKWVGQKQKWFAMRLDAPESRFDLTAHPSLEFSSWKWADLVLAPDTVIPFKRNIYERLAVEFNSFSVPLK